MRFIYRRYTFSGRKIAPNDGQDVPGTYFIYVTTKVYHGAVKPKGINPRKMPITNYC